MNPVYEDLNMKIKLWEEEIIPCYLTEKEEKKKSYAFFKKFSWDSRTYALCKENCELCAAGAALL